MSYKPFKMKGSPMKRNFGIGRTEDPIRETPLNKIDLKTMFSNIGSKMSANVKESGGWGEVAKKALAAGMGTLKGGYDAYNPKDKKEEGSLSSDEVKGLFGYIENMHKNDPENEEYVNLLKTLNPKYIVKGPVDDDPYEGGEDKGEGEH